MKSSCGADTALNASSSFLALAMPLTTAMRRAAPLPVRSAPSPHTPASFESHATATPCGPAAGPSSTPPPAHTHALNRTSMKSSGGADPALKASSSFLAFAMPLTTAMRSSMDPPLGVLLLALAALLAAASEAPPAGAAGAGRGSEMVACLTPCRPRTWGLGAARFRFWWGRRARGPPGWSVGAAGPRRITCAFHRH